MAELVEKALALSISALLLTAGFKVAQISLLPLVSTVATLTKYDVLVDRLRRDLQQADASPVRLKFETSLPEGLSITGDGKDLLLVMDTSIGQRTDKIHTSRDVVVQRSVVEGSALIVIDSKGGYISVEIGGR